MSDLFQLARHVLHGFVEGDRIARCLCGHVELTEAEGVTKIKHCKTCRVLITLKCKAGRLTYGHRRT